MTNNYDFQLILMRHKDGSEMKYSGFIGNRFENDSNVVVDTAICYSKSFPCMSY